LKLERDSITIIIPDRSLSNLSNSRDDLDSTGGRNELWPRDYTYVNRYRISSPSSYATAWYSLMAGTNYGRAIIPTSTDIV